MRKHIYALTLAIILFISLFFRLYYLSSVPPSPSLDEVTTGYNAYSILHTGRDEYGNFMPLLLRAYDDWRPAFYIYFTVPFIWVFGLSVFAVRFPSVLLSEITVLLSFFITIELFKDYKYKKKLGLLVSFFLVISPWHIYISRLGHEANLGLATACVSIYIFLLAMNKQKKAWLLILSAAFFALSLNTYQSEKVFIPAIVLILAVLYLKKLFLNKKILVISIFLGLLIALPIFKASTSSQGLMRLQTTSAFSDLRPIYEQTARLLLQDNRNKNVVGEIMHNRRMVIPTIFITNYMSHFAIFWLFGNGGYDAFKAPGVGLLYLWELPFVLIGFFALLFQKTRTKVLVFGWLAVSFIAPAITTQSPHAMRAFNALPMPQVLSAFGFLTVAQVLIKKEWRFFLLTAYILIIGFFILFDTTRFYQQYFYVFPKKESNSFQYALSSAVIYSFKEKSLYKRIVFSNADNLLQSYMFYLFYSKFDPRTYQEMGGTKSGGFAQFHTIGDIDFIPLNYEKDKKRKDTLLIGNVADFPAGIGYVTSFSNLDGKQVILAVHNQ